MTAHRIALDGTRPQRWRNGGGTTRELFAWPRSDDWRVRVSVADVETDGPFSTFPGVERWFAVLEGDGVALTIDGVDQTCRVGDPPLAFSGESAVDCRLLRGPTRDLNLMLRATPGAMQPVENAEQWNPGTRQCGVYALVAGRCVAGDDEIEVPAGSLLWFAPAPGSLAFRRDLAGPPRVPGWWLAADATES